MASHIHRSCSMWLLRRRGLGWLLLWRRHKGREVLNEPRGNAESSLAAYDFDGDGRKEVFYQNGDEFSLTVYGFKGRKLEELGSVTCNNGLIIADDGLCASLYGFQGLCDMFRIRDGKMEISPEEDIRPLLFSSRDFKNRKPPVYHVIDV